MTAPRQQKFFLAAPHIMLGMLISCLAAARASPLSTFLAALSLAFLFCCLISIFRHVLRPDGALLYHCTSECSAAAIKRNGFRCGARGIVGGGIYFAVSIKDAVRKAHHKGVVLECKVDLGKVHDVSFQGDTTLNLARIKQLGCNSVRVHRNGEPGTEYCVYEPSRVRVIGEHRDAWPCRQALTFAALVAVIVVVAYGVHSPKSAAAHSAAASRAVGSAIADFCRFLFAKTPHAWQFIGKVISVGANVTASCLAHAASALTSLIALCYRALAFTVPRVLQAADKVIVMAGSTTVQALYGAGSAFASICSVLIGSVPAAWKASDRVTGVVVLALGTKFGAAIWMRSTRRTQ
jgi:hypothetical protein